jgi:hypothetical protein
MNPGSVSVFHSPKDTRRTTTTKRLSRSRSSFDIKYLQTREELIEEITERSFEAMHEKIHEIEKQTDIEEGELKK